MTDARRPRPLVPVPSTPTPPPAAAPTPPPKRPFDAAIDTDDSRPRRLGWWIVLLGFGGFLAWATLAKLDAGVPVPGTVVVAGQRQAVQPMVAGKVAAILARDGDRVAANDVLLRLDSTSARSEFEIAQTQWFGALAAKARLEAESRGADRVDFPPELRSPEAGNAGAAAMAQQYQLFESRRRTLESEVAVLREILQGNSAQLSSLNSVATARSSQLRILNEELVDQRVLADEGFLARNRVLEQERTLATLQGAQAEDSGARARSAQAVAETQARIASMKSAYVRDAEVQLSPVLTEANALRSRLDALRFQLEASEIRAPASGVVIGSTVHTVGGVVPAGQAVMEIVPTDAKLVVEARIPRQLIDKVHTGLPVDVLFSAFGQSSTPQVPGRVVRISPDALIDEKAEMAYYLAQIEVTPEGMAELGKHQIQPGMPAEAFIRTGERSPLNYLLKPLRDRTRRALAEP
jgi:protease secretion system membrane fusion protein